MLELSHHEDVIGLKTVVPAIGFQVNVYFYYIDGLLVDTGPKRGKKDIVPYIQKTKIDQVVVTHHHEDHTGLASWIVNNKQIPLYAHESGIELCRKNGDMPYYRKLFWGRRKGFDTQEIPLQVETNKYKFKVIHTPGHADDHVVLLDEENGRLFGGDLYVLGKPKSIWHFENIPVLMDSIRKVLTYDFSTVYCCHAGILQDGKQKLRAKLNYLEESQTKVKELHKEGKTVKEIANELFPHKNMLNYFSFFDTSPVHLVKSMLS
ncbi:MBL fold metallo-hydrolase [Chengkuizengella axinellae]|uniref:MBL fold metallo-hydrolase n=1 Tax=Chengkuizengella axinellae TaxID=3064388 RepID=A0ABT9J2W4_9BACL|nr:MBL fold metallo-hydrolase [Chengkuizengella sp. 2205SS18-9]MDP5275941.1 MBL fold metallo-hydrolase [Chengkuizengella sp. 2205SS18-9]